MADLQHDARVIDTVAHRCGDKGYDCGSIIDNCVGGIGKTKQLKVSQRQLVQVALERV